jgi:hypothetical protein
MMSKEEQDALKRTIRERIEFHRALSEIRAEVQKLNPRWRVNMITERERRV